VYSFLHVATASNTWETRTVIELRSGFVHLEDQVVLVCLQYGRPSPLLGFAESLELGNVAVQFVNSIQRWTIVSTGARPIPLGATFGVAIFEHGNPNAWIHRASEGNTRDNFTRIDYPASQNIGKFEMNFPGISAQDMLFVTPRLPATHTAHPPQGWYLPAVNDLVLGANSVLRLRDNVLLSGLFDHSIGVWFDERSAGWAIFNADFAPMSPRGEYSVYLTGTRQHGSSTDHFRAVVTTGMSGAKQPFCLYPCEPGYAFFATQNASFAYSPLLDGQGAPRSTSVSFCADPTAVSVQPVKRESRWELAVATQNASSFRRGVGFNLLHLAAGG
jgi:hypothetical protein